MSLSRVIYDIFYESAIAYAVGTVTEGRVAYHPVEEIPTLDLIQRHIDKEIVLGAYTVLPGDEVRWFAWDIDSKKLGITKARELTKKISDFLTENGIQHGVEFSGGKGYHVEGFFQKKESAKKVKEVGEKIRDILGLPKKGDPHVEFFPKQGELTESNPFGNLLRLPLGKHPKTERAAFFVNTTDWEDGDALDPETIFSQRIELCALEKLIIDQDPMDQIVNLLAPYWQTGQRHDISLCVSGFLANLGWTEEVVIQLISSIHEQSPEGDLRDQTKTVTSTFKKFYEGEKILGFNGLSEILPGSVLKELQTLAGEQNFTVTLQQIDRIRLDKGPAFLKVRHSAQMILTHLKENGRLVRDVNDTYWLNYDERSLVKVAGENWTRLSHKLFGINTAEAFGKQVTESVKHMTHDQAKLVKVYTRAYWDGKYLYINLGGPEVYILCGDPEKRRVMLNGEGDILFLNSEDTLHVPNLLEVDDPPISPWSYLTDDVNFKKGDNISATPDQQRELLKAFFISIFFAETLPTRPILTFLADPGAGKTTTARRFLRFLEGPDQDVLSIVSDKPDSFRTSITKHKFLVLDNLEKTKASWLTDSLNRISTGSHLEIRKLHTTNESYRIIPTCFVAVTATSMPFSDETVYTRLLPIELDALTSFRSEKLIQTQLLDNLNSYWLGMFDDLDKAVYELTHNTTVEIPSTTRLADFSVFCSRIQKADFLKGDQLMAGLANLVNRQKRVLEENSPFIDVLQSWQRSVGYDPSKWMNSSEMFSIFTRVATIEKKEWRWTTAQGLSKHIGMLESQLIQNFGMGVRTTKEGGRDVKQYRFPKIEIRM